MTDFLFDGPTKIIQEPAGVGDTSFDVGEDLYSAWKRWLLLSDNAKYDPAFAVEGGTPIGATGLFTGTTYILVNGWKVKPANHDHQLFLNGNLYSSDGIVTVPADTANTNVFINSSVAAQGVATGGGLSAVESARLAELWRLAGLDPTAPLVVDPDNRTAGPDINQTITKDPLTDTVTVERNPDDPTP